jgi:hypothetical protein
MPAPTASRPVKRRRVGRQALQEQAAGFAVDKTEEFISHDLTEKRARVQKLA